MNNSGDSDAESIGKVVGALVQAAGDSPEGKAAASEFGSSAVVVAKFLRNGLLPLAAVNYGFGKAREYFSEIFPREIGEKTANLPIDKLVEPAPVVAGPTVQGLVFAHEEDELRNMFVSLIATAMSKDTAENAHPAYADIIRQLNPDDAKNLQRFFFAESPARCAE